MHLCVLQLLPQSEDDRGEQAPLSKSSFEEQALLYAGNPFKVLQEVIEGVVSSSSGVDAVGRWGRLDHQGQ